MKVVILAGGFGIGPSEYTKVVPKPMVKINKKTIILYIMEISVWSQRFLYCSWV